MKEVDEAQLTVILIGILKDKQPQARKWVTAGRKSDQRNFGHWAFALVAVLFHKYFTVNTTSP